MRIDSVSNPTGRSSSAGADNVMARSAPAHVGNLHWQLADANERQALLRQGAQDGGGTAPAEQPAEAGQAGQGAGPSSAAPSAAPENAGGGQATSAQGKGALGGDAVSPYPGNFSAGGMLLGGGQGLVQGGNAALRKGAEALADGQKLLDRSKEIFTKYPAQLVMKWAFYESPVNHRGGATAPLRETLDKEGIDHNGKKPHPKARGSVANASQARAAGVPVTKINNHNGAMAELDRRAHYQSQGFDVSSNRTVQTAGRKRDIDITATRDVGHPTRSIEIHEEVKVGRRSLPSVPSGSNEHAQAKKDGARLAEYQKNAPAAHAEGHAAYDKGNKAVDAGEKLSGAGKALKVVGKIARPIGVVVSAFEIGGAYKADGNRIGVNTVGKVAGMAGAAGGAWAGAAAGAALGSIVPGVGTVIGGIVGGIAGGLLGEGVVSGAFDKIKSSF